jgi:hypothetical protein
MDDKKQTRFHDRQKRRRSSSSEAERFFLQGARWRFPREIGLAEVQVRIGRLRALWSEQEAFCQSAVLLDLEPAAGLDGFALDDAVAFVHTAERTKRPGQVEFKSEPVEGIPKGPSWLQRTIETKGIVKAAREGAWSPLTSWIAEQIRLGVQPVRLPPWRELIESVSWDGKIEFRFRCLASLLLQPSEAQPARSEQLSSRDALALYRSLVRVFPSVPWAMHEHQIENVVRLHEQQARESLSKVADINFNETLPVDLAAKLSPVSGTFHQALRSYSKKRKADFTKGGEFDGSGHHMLGLVDNFSKRQPDVLLSKLDFAACQKIYDFWRDRPLNTRTEQPLSAKHCSSHLGELDRFFKWLHTTSEFAWRRPDDFDLIDRKVKRLDSDRRSIHAIELKTYQVEHLALLYKHALPGERLKMLWCLNCSHGAAEIGRVEWGDLYLLQPHPWGKEGLKYQACSSDSWCGLLRPKTDVIGWWWLWPETVQLVQNWREEIQRHLKRELKPSERMLVTKTGESLYRDSSRNAQTGFANEWSRLFRRVEKAEGKHAIPQLPFGTLRDQMSNWLGSDENEAVLASTALAHGIPHKGDKLLYKHYSNRPWSHLFQKQREYRQVLQPMFEAGDVEC